MAYNQLRFVHHFWDLKDLSNLTDIAFPVKIDLTVFLSVYETTIFLMSLLFDWCNWLLVARTVFMLPKELKNGLLCYNELWPFDCLQTCKETSQMLIYWLVTPLWHCHFSSTEEFSTQFSLFCFQFYGYIVQRKNKALFFSFLFFFLHLLLINIGFYLFI